MSKPCVAIAMMMVVTALEDCNNAVNTIPNNKRRKGFFSDSKRLMTASDCLYTLIDDDIISNPKNTKPKPAIAKPIDFTLSFLASISIITPINSKEIKTGSRLSDVPQAAICAVTVVPIFAPIIIAVA